MIPNHYTPKLSELDLLMVRSVPPGGNWKNIPKEIPSQRLEQIRISYAKGEGSRSTYYGRMKADAPAHTISTYFNRPGNGAFIHYSQDRMISQREAARLQSFPDSFVFSGSKAEINKQIGNAVPPILAYQIAKTAKAPGEYIDIFSGAGGLSLGFHMAGWTQLVANDIDRAALQTYSGNLGGQVVHGDICNPDVFNELVSIINSKPRHDKPRILLGGPPCQGFSTAGNRRSMEDTRNHLFQEYAKLLSKITPDAFLFENVIGLRNMEGGRVLKMVIRTLEEAGYETDIRFVSTENYALPQRRKRILIFGKRAEPNIVTLPSQITSWDDAQSSILPSPPTILDAIADLPELEPGQDGSHKAYQRKPSTQYQEMMRDLVTVDDYLDKFKKRDVINGRR